MKKYIGISILLVVIALVATGSVVFYTNMGHMKEYFENKSKKMKLASDESVDSLNSVITFKCREIDSLRVVITSDSAAIANSVKANKELKQVVTNLNNAINHQNTMVKTLSEQVSRLTSETGKK
jgi:peptidoglycan hydrolase CwlO-like protein